MNILGLFIQHQIQQEKEKQYQVHLDELDKKYSTEQLKKFWDEYDGCDDSISVVDITGEEIHLLLNKRGEGSYCAV